VASNKAAIESIAPTSKKIAKNKGNQKANSHFKKEAKP
jgi:hypothetical protein